jgi:DNA-binding response OmpR family regulator
MHSPQDRILVVDDHADTRELLVLLLTAGHYIVKTASTIDEATKLAEAEKFSLLIFDAWLPDGDGVELCRNIRQFDQTTPIVFCSGLAYEKDKQHALDAGAQVYLVKPIDPFKLVKSVDDLIDALAQPPATLAQPPAKGQSVDGDGKPTPPTAARPG